MIVRNDTRVHIVVILGVCDFLVHLSLIILSERSRQMKKSSILVVIPTGGCRSGGSRLVGEALERRPMRYRVGRMVRASPETVAA